MSKAKSNPEPPCRCTDGIVYTPWITRNGKRVYKKGGGVFAFRCTRCSNNI